MLKQLIEGQNDGQWLAVCPFQQTCSKIFTGAANQKVSVANACLQQCRERGIKPGR